MFRGEKFRGNDRRTGHALNPPQQFKFKQDTTTTGQRDEDSTS